MSQHDMILDNANGATFRADANAGLQALASTSKGTGRPSTSYAGQLWLDDNSPSASVWTLYMYDGTDDIALGQIDVTNNRFNPMTAQSADVASASTIDLDAAYGTIVDVTGTGTAITAVTLAQGKVRVVRFPGALTLTHGSSLVLPGAADILTVAGDYAILVGYASSVVRCVGYFRGTGTVTACPSFHANKNGTDQTGITSATYTKLTFGTEEWDVGSHYDASNSKFQPTIPGKYRIDASAYFSGGVVDQSAYITAIYKNGSLIKQSLQNASGTGGLSPQVTALVTLNGSSDYIEIYGWGGGAGNKTVGGITNASYFCGHYVGP